MDDYALAIDVGGTFTDIVLLNLTTGDFQLLKTPSTPDDPSRGFIAGISQILNTNGVAYSQVSRIFHGTTIATNAILEGKGTLVGVLVSEGFKYVLEIGRHSMARLANPHVWVKPERPVPPERVLEIPERTAFDGAIITALDEDAVRSAAAHFRSGGIESIAVSLTHSYANPTHELRVQELVLEEFPEAHLSLSSEVLPVFREYERTITTVLNAYVMPRVSYYIENLDRELRDLGVEAPLLIMKSNGGVIGVETATRQPVYTALSGPADKLDFAHFKRRKQGNRQVGGTERPGLSVYQGRRRTVKNPRTPATGAGAPGRWHPRRSATAWRTKPLCDGPRVVVAAEDGPPGWSRRRVPSGLA